MKIKKLLILLVEEKPTGEISVGAGAGTDGGTIGFFGVKENNFLGKGIKLDSKFNLSEESIKGEFFIQIQILIIQDNL